MKRFLLILLALAQCLALCACAAGNGTEETTQPIEAAVSEADSWQSRPLNVIDDKHRTYYEVFVYSFCDSDGDGIGDLQGVTEKLDYIQELGFNGIWLMPITPSTTYHKYDATDYMDVDPEYGTLEDFQALVEECHRRDIRVILDLMLNHSSSKHSWFLTAAEYLRSLPEGAEPDAAECPYVDYYHFTQAPGAGYSAISGTNWYYEANFWSEMPDLNLESPAVRAEFEAIADFWLGLGADGFRLDAVKEFVSGSVDANVEILSWFNDYVKSVDPDAYIVCECWMDQVTYAQYYASGVDSMFDFNFADSSGVIASILKGNRPASAYGKAQAEAQALYASYNPDYINAPFYTNHDMGRSAGYFAGEGSEERTKMGNAMNLLMSGNVFVYYGEELGMKGSGADENKRAPMYWSADKTADGMCAGPAGMGKVEMKYPPLEEQAEDPGSIYNYVKQAILLRNQNPEIARGTVTYYDTFSDDAVCVLTKSYGGRELLLVLNTSDTAKTVRLESLSVQGCAVSGLSVLGQLLTGEEDPALDGNTVTMPAFSILLMGTENE